MSHNNNINSPVPIIPFNLFAFETFMHALTEFGIFVHMLRTNLAPNNFANMQTLFNEVIAGLYPIEDFITIGEIFLENAQQDVLMGDNTNLSNTNPSEGG